MPRFITLTCATHGCNFLINVEHILFFHAFGVKESAPDDLKAIADNGATLIQLADGDLSAKESPDEIAGLIRDVIRFECAKLGHIVSIPIGSLAFIQPAEMTDENRARAEKEAADGDENAIGALRVNTILDVGRENVLHSIDTFESLSTQIEALQAEALQAQPV